MEKHLTTSEVAEIMGQTDEALRNKFKRDEAPWSDDDRVAGKHRRFGVFHLVAHAAGEMLVSQGLNWEQAAQVMRSCEKNVRAFVEAEGGEGKLTFILSERQQVHDSFTNSFRWEPIFPAMVGSPEDIAATMAHDLQRIGRTRERSAPVGGGHTIRTIGFHFAPVCLNEAYWVATERAAHHGYRIEGGKVLKVASGLVGEAKVD